MAAAAIALGAPQTAPQQPTQLPDVTVENRPLEEIVRTFVDEVADPLPGFGPARWDRRLCVGVAYLRPPLARFMVQRVGEIAREIGVETGSPGCRPNVLVVAAADGDEMARAMVGARSSLFLTNVTGANRSRSALEAFQAADEPVRWWHISLPVNTYSEQAAVSLPGGAPGASSGETGSRLRTELRNDLQRVFVIVDFNRASGTSIGPLSDYVAMVALAQVNPDADTSGYDTILNLFDGPGAPSGLTDWDRSYLQALYDAHLDQQQPGAQLEAVTRVMARTRQGSPEGER
ncbi:hypothetical protein ASD25_18850 [Brevundimonas sp. Root1423]|nr:hypothetical protein ASD25_18850 [Brevundimonas sp. Root1423]